MWDQPFISESNVELSRLLEAEFTTHCTTFEASKESGVVGGGVTRGEGEGVGGKPFRL